MAVLEGEPRLCMGPQEPVCEGVRGPIQQADGTRGTLQPLLSLHQIVCMSNKL